MGELHWEIFHKLFNLLWLILFPRVCWVFFSKQRQLGQGSRRKSTTFCCFIILAWCPGILFPWQPFWTAYLLFSFYSACVCVCVCECACVGVPAEQFPLMRKARRRFLGDVMKYLEGNSARTNKLLMFTARKFLEAGLIRVGTCTYMCVCVRIYVCV